VVMVKKEQERLRLRTSAAGTSSTPVTRRRRKLTQIVRLLPIVLSLAYLNLTVFLFACGPWRYPVADGTTLYIFLAFAHLALLGGYLSAAFGKPQGYCGPWKVKSIIVVSIVVNLLLLFPTAALNTGSFLPDVLGGIANPGAVYSTSLAVRKEWTPMTAIAYLRIFVGPLLFLLLPLTVFYWRCLGWTARGLAVFSLLGVVATYVAMGTNKVIGETAFLIPWLLLAGCCAGVSRFSRNRKVLAIIGSVVAFLFFFSFFTKAMSTRSSAMRSGYFRVTDKLALVADYNHILVRLLPQSVQGGVVGLTMYMTHGYYALYLALQEPFVPMFGLGSSPFLARQAARITGVTEIMNLPYPVRIEKHGWDATLMWSSIYPWIASDVSFPGTVIVLFFIGRLFALSWLDTARGRNPFAVAMFTQFLVMLFYFPANNQVLLIGENVTAFWGTLLLWLFTRRKYAWGVQSQGILSPVSFARKS
jgi:hypothetical protein